MTAQPETTNPVWDDARDTAFFRITAGLFPEDLVFAAGVLLASYDDDMDEISSQAAAAGATLAR